MHSIACTLKPHAELGVTIAIQGIVIRTSRTQHPRARQGRWKRVAEFECYISLARDGVSALWSCRESNILTAYVL
jgi:hypothetical protein